MGVKALLDGTKSQDLQEDRPGLIALKEYSVLSPMLDSSFDARFIIHAKNIIIMQRSILLASHVRQLVSWREKLPMKSWI